MLSNTDTVNMFSSSRHAPSLPGPVGLNREFCQHNKGVTYVITKRKWASSFYDLRVTYEGDEQDKNAFEPFQIMGSFSGKCMIYSASGQHLLTLRRRSFTWAPSYEIYHPDTKQILATLKGHWGYRSNLDIVFANTASGQNEHKHLELCTGRSVVKSEVHEAGLVIATIEREDSKWRRLSEPYRLTVAPNFDVSLALAINMCMHNHLRPTDHNRSAAGASASSGATAAAISASAGSSGAC